MIDVNSDQANVQAYQRSTVSPQQTRTIQLTEIDERTPTEGLQSLTTAQSRWREIFQQQQIRTMSSPIRRPVSLSRRNMRENIPWGDNLEGKQAQHTRICANNLSGIHLDRRGGYYDELCKIIKEVGADVFCGQEHNLDTTQSAVRNIMYETTNQQWDQSRLIFGSSPITFTSQYKPGGTMMLTVGNTSARVIAQKSDKWCRWVSQEFTGRGGKKIAIFSCYQVVYKPS
jgi:hypothetical protein